MSGFSPTQLKKLTAKLDRAHVQSRCVEGREIDYIEGWFALSEANAIFGFANWDREMVHFERLFERTRGETTVCAYSARVRVRVRAGDQTISREGTGCGAASARSAADAHERAIKAAETDATKRALATFGNRFGLCLYDKDQAGVREPASRTLEILCPDGQLFATSLSPEAFCTALRKLIESTTDSTELAAWRACNAPAIVRLRMVAPELKTLRGEHYADVLERLFATRLAAATLAGSGDASNRPPDSAAAAASHDRTTREAGAISPQLSTDLGAETAAPGAHSRHMVGHCAEANGGRVALVGSPACTVTPDESRESAQGSLAPSRIARGLRIDKASLGHGFERRYRDKAHLLAVAQQPCLVCGRQPSHAHHVRYAQKRGLGQKVSDEFVVPLCFLHHAELHNFGPETTWWKRRGIDPLAVAQKLWASSRDRELDASTASPGDD